MERKKLFSSLAQLVVFISVINFLAIGFHWYYLLWWFDMPMHFLGGLWVGLFFLWYLMYPTEIKYFFAKVILGVLIIGVAWEVFELILNYKFTQDRYDMLDTVSDIFFDLSGGLVAVFYFSIRAMNIKESKLKLGNAEKS